MTDYKKECFLCNSIPDTKEHIIPQWLQRHFNLSNQKLGLWNDTILLYKQATFPLCKKCNGTILSNLEKRIESNSATEIDYFLWALKIRFLFSLKDTTLQLDRTDFLKGKLIEIQEAMIGQEFVKHSLNSLATENFIFKPNPFGTIILFDNPIRDGEFGFADIPHPYWGLAISLPNHKILAVLFTDRGLVKKELLKEYKIKGGLKNYCKELPAMTTNELIRQLMLRLLLKQYQIKNIPYGVSLVEKGVFSKPIPNSPNFRKKLKKEVLVDISQVLKVDIKFGIAMYDALPENYKG